MELNQIVSAYPHIVFKKGDYLISQEEKIDYMFYLFSGSVIGSIIDINGNEYMFDEILPQQGINSIAALGMALLDQTSTKFNFIALSETTCCKIPSSVIQEYLLQHPEQLLQFTKKLMGHYINTCQRLNTRNASHTIQDYCKFILQHSKKTNGEFILDKKFNNNEISQLIGVHPVTLSRMRTALLQYGCIEKTAKGLKICNMPLLKSCAEGLTTIEYRKKNIL